MHLSDLGNDMVDGSGRYYQGLNTALLDAVPHSAVRVLEVGCAQGRLGEVLKKRREGRKVIGVEKLADAASMAARRLDQVITADIETEELDDLEGGFDVILYGDVLEHLRDPETVLRKHRTLLAPDGVILCSVPNIQHHSIFKALAIGDFQYVDAGLLDRTHLRFFTFSSFTKLLLDSDYKPSLESTTESQLKQEDANALKPLIRRAGGVPDRILKDMAAYQYIFKGEPLFDGPCPESREGVTIVAAVNNKARLNANLLASPDLMSGRDIQFLGMKGKSSAAQAYNEGIEQASQEIVILVHQDVYLPRGFISRFISEFRKADQRPGGIGVAGVFGVVGEGNPHGRVMDRYKFLDRGKCFPADVNALDELLLAVKRDTPLRFDPKLGWDFYGADICQQAIDAGMGAVALNAPVYHNSLVQTVGKSFYTSGMHFKRKWADRLPIATSCTVVGKDWPHKKRTGLTDLVARSMRKVFGNSRSRSK